MNTLRLVFIVLRLLIVAALVVVLSPLILVGLVCWWLVGSLGDGPESEGQRRSRIGR